MNLRLVRSDLCARCGKNNLHEIGGGCVVDGQRFNYGLAGAFLFSSPQHYAEGSSLCAKCVGEIGSKPLNETSCGLCNTKFHTCWVLPTSSEASDHGFGCASHVVRRTLTDNRTEIYIQCDYGSKHDFDVYRTNEDLKEGLNMCDACLEKRIKDGSAVLISSMD